MKSILTRISALLVLSGFIAVSFALWFFRPDVATETEPETASIAVDTSVVRGQPYSVILGSYGLIRPTVASSLSAQVSGEIVNVNPNIRNGGVFQIGDVLFEIDPVDYEANVDIAAAALSDAEQVLAEAEARTNQASQDWVRLGNSGDPPPLVLRLPHLKAAEAGVRAASAELRKAEVELQRTRIVAPYDGRALEKLVDVGQVVSSGTPLAEIYSIESVEIRLPLRNSDLQFIDLPESLYPSSSLIESHTVTLQSELDSAVSWPADLVRTESAIDEAARQLHVIAEIRNPFAVETDGGPALKIFQYVTAEIQGRIVPDAIVVPVSAIYQNSFVYVAEGDYLQLREVDIAWQNGEEAIIASGLSEGDELILTLLGQVTSGIGIERTNSLIPEDDEEQGIDSR